MSETKSVQPNPRKKQKVEKTKNANGTVLYYCEYVLPKDNKKCRLMRKKSNKYCAEHILHQQLPKDASNSSNSLTLERVPCPLDPNHTIWKSELDTHVLKCNARPKENRDPWFELNYNSRLQSGGRQRTQKGDNDNFDLADDFTITESKVLSIINGLEYPALELRVCEHKGLKPHLEERTFQKHILQQSSLIGNLKRLDMLSQEFFYMEFGCGKGELSRYINQCILEDVKGEKHQKKMEEKNSIKNGEGSHYGYGLIDRGKNRLKADSKIITDSESSESSKILPQIKRSKIDIKDLNVSKFLEDVDYKNVVTVSKHLCGAATDLTLKLLLNSDLFSKDKFAGVLIAMCCRHVCSHDQLLPQSKKYLFDHGFESKQSFNVLKKIVSWAVDAKDDKPTRAKFNEGDEGNECNECNGKTDTNARNETNKVNAIDENHPSGLTSKQRQEYGLKARRIIDESRAFAMRSILGEDYNVELFWYIEDNITLENVCLSIVKQKKTECKNRKGEQHQL